MRLLLDTHSFLWFITGSPHLHATAKALIEDPANDLWLSMASAAEIEVSPKRRESGDRAGW